MIEIRLENKDYEQDIRPLMRAFFPREEIRVAYLPYDPKEERREGSAPVDLPENAPAYYILAVRHTAEEVRAWFLDEKGTKLADSFTFPEPETDRRQYKNDMKRVLYRILTGYTGRELPWGTLTGIRPVKLAADAIEAGEAEADVRAFYKTQYLCTDEKADLAMEIAVREHELLKKLDYRNGYSIYVGIPFCPTTCLYCSFTSYPVGTYKKHVDAYLDALEKELDFAAYQMPGMLPGKKLQTVYIGGGTPTALTHEQLRRLITMLREKFPMDQVAEFTVEAGRPDSITPEKLAVMKELGVTRMSINPQTMVQRTLDVIGRRHTVEQVHEAFHMARAAGMDDINMDLIIGLPGETVEDTKITLEQVEALNPDDLTVHALAIKRAAKLKLKLDELGDLMKTDARSMQELTHGFAMQHGYRPYYLYRQKNIADNLENVGYARPGKEGLYNILMMEEKQTIVGLGAGSSCKFVFREGDRIERTENVKYVLDYIERIDEMIDRKKYFLTEFGQYL